jgi:hypothetical protein
MEENKSYFVEFSLIGHQFSSGFEELEIVHGEDKLYKKGILQNQSGDEISFNDWYVLLLMQFRYNSF